MKRLALLAAILSFPFAAQAANDGGGVAAGLLNIRLCIEAGGNNDACGMRFATTDELAWSYAVSALVACGLREEGPLDNSDLMRLAHAELMRECRENRTYIKHRWRTSN